MLHACHISSFASSGNNISTNAILLRSDIHDLFDANLIAIRPDTKRIVVHSSLKGTLYFELNGQFLKERNDKKEIDFDALNERWKLFNDK